MTKETFWEDSDSGTTFRIGEQWFILREVDEVEDDYFSGFLSYGPKYDVNAPQDYLSIYYSAISEIKDCEI